MTRPILDLTGGSGGSKPRYVETPHVGPRDRPNLTLNPPKPSASGEAMGRAIADMVKSVTYARTSGRPALTPPHASGDPFVVDTHSSPNAPHPLHPQQFDRQRPILKLNK